MVSIFSLKEHIKFIYISKMLYLVLYLKYMANKDLLYKIGNSTQYSVVT